MKKRNLKLIKMYQILINDNEEINTRIQEILNILKR